LAIIWDESGEKSGIGQGFRVLITGEGVAHSKRLARLVGTLAENKQNETNKNDDDVRRVGGLARNERCRAGKYNLF